MKPAGIKTALVAGGAGFIGSHLCDALIAEGARVVCIDNLLTGRTDNLRHLEREPRFDFIRADVIDGLPAALAGRHERFTHVYNLACAASPPHYRADPLTICPRFRSRGSRARPVAFRLGFAIAGP